MSYLLAKVESRLGVSISHYTFIYPTLIKAGAMAMAIGMDSDGDMDGDRSRDSDRDRDTDSDMSTGGDMDIDGVVDHLRHD